MKCLVALESKCRSSGLEEQEYLLDLVIQVWFTNHQHQHHLEAAKQYRPPELGAALHQGLHVILIHATAGGVLPKNTFLKIFISLIPHYLRYLRKL